MHTTCSNNSLSLTRSLNGMGILGHGTKGGLEVVVDLVYVLVQSLVVEESVEEVVPGILNDSTQEAATQDGVPAREVRT